MNFETWYDLNHGILSRSVARVTDRLNDPEVLCRKEELRQAFIAGVNAENERIVKEMKELFEEQE